MKKWKVDSFGSIAVQKAKVLNLVSHWDKEKTTRILTDQELEERNLACEEHKRGALMEKVSWRQKSQELWLKEWDKITKFCHKMANAHQRKNSLARVKIEDGWLTEEEKINEAVVGHFHNLLTAPDVWRPGVNGFQFKQLERQDVFGLEKQFSEEEVYSALRSFSGDKALGPDGFTMTFWQFSWDFVKEEVIAFFREFHTQTLCQEPKCDFSSLDS